MKEEYTFLSLMFHGICLIFLKIGCDGLSCFTYTYQACIANKSIRRQIYLSIFRQFWSVLVLHNDTRVSHLTFHVDCGQINLKVSSSTSFGNFLTQNNIYYRYAVMIFMGSEIILMRIFAKNMYPFIGCHPFP
jgi:hypothetical protein